MHRVNAGFTLLAPIHEDLVDAAKALLRDLNADQTRLPFAESTTTHFATITVIPAQHYNDTPLPATLLFATSFCGPVRAHTSEVVRIMGAGLRQIFAHCEGFDAACADDELEDWMLAHRHGDTFYSGMQHLSPLDVRRHHELRAAIEAYLDERESSGSASEVRRDIQEFVTSRSDLAWAREPFAPTFGAWFAFNWRQLAIEAAVAMLLACTVLRWFVASPVLGVVVCAGWLAVLAFVLLVIVMVLNIRDAEDRQTYVSARPSDARARELAATQLRPVINEFTLAGPIKEEGLLRPLFLRIGLWVIGRVFDGFPGLPYIDGTRIPTVATARWIVADGGRRVMFISNYTNDGEPYVRDFIETHAGAMRINLSFGFGAGFPNTRWILWRGALERPNEYLYSLAENQLETQFWYGPYRDISIDNIVVNRRIREGLFAEMTEDEARAWLQLL